jgi:hypothetical protein
MDAIYFGDIGLFVDIGGMFTDLNFKIWYEKELLYPIHLATIIGNESILEIMLKNKSIDINVKNDSGMNSFYLASLFC